MPGGMAHERDWQEEVRAAAYPRLQAMLGRIGSRYDDPVTTREQFVGLVEKGEEAFEKDLERMGFDRAWLSSFQRLEGTDRLEEGNWAWRGRIEDPHDPGTFHADPYGPDQLHLRFFELDDDLGTVALFAHYEANPWTRPVPHYLEHGVDTAFGWQAMRTALHDHFGDAYGEMVEEDVDVAELVDYRDGTVR